MRHVPGRQNARRPLQRQHAAVRMPRGSAAQRSLLARGRLAADKDNVPHPRGMVLLDKTSAARCSPQRATVCMLRGGALSAP